MAGGGAQSIILFTSEGFVGQMQAPSSALNPQPNPRETLAPHMCQRHICFRTLSISQTDRCDKKMKQRINLKLFSKF